MKTILLIAHPGHELRIFRWMETTRPVVSILSDGSGGDQTSRTTYSTASIRAAKAECGPVFGRYSDKHWYSAMLAKDSTPFLQVVDDIVMSVRGETIATVVSDAVDGYNPLHDLTEAIGAAVVRRLAALGNSVAHLESAAVPGVNGTTAVELRLDASARYAKSAAVKAYLPLAQEAQRILRDDPESLAREILLEPSFEWPADFQPSWEKFSKERVDLGRYATPISYRDHVRPIALAILGKN